MLRVVCWLVLVDGCWLRVVVCSLLLVGSCLFIVCRFLLCVSFFEKCC